jgi:hypothetical protein
LIDSEDELNGGWSVVLEFKIISLYRTYSEEEVNLFSILNKVDEYLKLNNFL